MSSTEINFNKFVKYVHEKFSEEISFQEVEDLLHLQEGYNKDSTTSLGKSLILNRLRFSGKKNTGEEFTYDRELFSGINVWIADNHKGKSTIFKIIKFAITGTDSIKPDIKRWIDEVILEFTIGQITYTCFIDRRGRDRGALYRFKIDDFLLLRETHKLEDTENNIEFAFKSKSQFEEYIQQFFFEQFSFYKLKYTQKSSGKEDYSLNTSELSWTTYFKSIYLESSNYDFLFFDKEDFGAQGKKIFEMILGLPLTYPINMLTIKHDKISEEIGKLKLSDKTTVENIVSNKKKLGENFKRVSRELTEAEKMINVSFDDKELVEEYLTIKNTVNEVRKQLRIAEEAYSSELARKRPIENELQNLLDDSKKIETEINRLSKQELNVELYRQAESFFTNLEIKVCPHCEIDVSKEKKEKELLDHTCSLCGEQPKQQKIEEEELKEKAERIKNEIQSHNFRKELVNKQIENTRHAENELRKSINILSRKIVEVPSIKSDEGRLRTLESQIEKINQDRKNQQTLFAKKDRLVREKAVLEFQLEQINRLKISDSTEKLTDLKLKKEILSYSLLALSKRRIELNSSILEILEDLILSEVNAFGLTSITKVKIDDKFNLIFTQNGVTVDFRDLEPGEKLRVKLGFYLSLIQLDIEHNLGRHPRFLIFDSPGSEEMVPKHLQGLSDILKDVNNRFNNQLQIFIGSALREFEQITDSEKTSLKKEDEFIF